MKRYDDKLWLLTSEEYKELPDGVRLLCIDNELVTKGKDYIDQDTRFGCLAFGLTKELIEEQNLQHEFLILLLKS
jgi:hypothetical protein